MTSQTSSTYLLGIDNGLTVTKAVVFDLDGRALGIGSSSGDYELTISALDRTQHAGSLAGLRSGHSYGH